MNLFQFVARPIICHDVTSWAPDHLRSYDASGDLVGPNVIPPGRSVSFDPHTLGRARPRGHELGHWRRYCRCVSSSPRTPPRHCTRSAAEKHTHCRPTGDASAAATAWGGAEAAANLAVTWEIFTTSHSHLTPCPAPPAAAAPAPDETGPENCRTRCTPAGRRAACHCHRHACGCRDRRDPLANAPRSQMRHACTAAARVARYGDRRLFLLGIPVT